jgi:hypothetical protein
MDESPRFRLPLLIAGQGQKEITHNEALLVLDAVIGATAESRVLAEPPLDPREGQCWLVPPTAAVKWNGRANELAIWSAGGWRYVDLPEGAMLFVKAERRRLRRASGAWEVDWPGVDPVASVDVPTGGAVVDLEVRAAVGLLIDRLRSLGLMMQ